MPKARIEGVELYYEIHGSGFPLVLIRGLGSNADHWYSQVPPFSLRFRLVIFDNRGIGRSGKPDVRYTIPMMADDTAGLMDALGISKAHILGLSMGGMIAQEFALRYPQMVGGLVLACTHCGGDAAVRPSGICSTFNDLMFSGTQEAVKKAQTCVYAEQTLTEVPEIIQKNREVSQKFPPDTEVLIRQLEAIEHHDTWERLPLIHAPTLVLAGKEDALIPPENSRILAERIPGARLQIIEGGGHLFLVEQEDVFNRTVLDFLEALRR